VSRVSLTHKATLLLLSLLLVVSVLVTGCSLAEWEAEWGVCIPEQAIGNVTAGGDSFLINSCNTTLTLTSADASVTFRAWQANTTVDMSAAGGGCADVFETINAPFGTDPVAGGCNDVLGFFSSDNTISMVGNAAADTIDFTTGFFGNVTAGGNATGSPIAGGNDTLFFTSDDGSVTFKSWPGNDTIDFSAAGGGNGSFNFAQTVTVAKSGGNFTTIQGAINAIVDAAAAKKYTILIFPGIYTENVVMKDYVSLNGMAGARGAVEITNNAGTVLTAGTGSNAVVRNIKLNVTGTAEAVNLPVGMTTKWIQFWNCSIESNYGAHGDDLITMNSGHLQVINSVIAYRSTGGANAHRLLNVVGASTQVYVINSLVQTDIDDVGGNDFTGFGLAAGANCNVLITSSTFEFDHEMTGGTSCLYKDEDTLGTTERDIYSNHLHMHGATGATGAAYCLDNVVTTIDSATNTIKVHDFDYNYLGDIGAAATLISHFDDVVVDPEVYAGAGTYVKCNSPIDAWLYADNINLTGVIDFLADYTASAPGDTVNLLDVVAQIQGSTGGDTHILDVSTGGIGSVEVVAVGTHAGVEVIHQHIGTFAVDTAQYWDGVGWNNVAGGGAIMTNDNDVLYIGGDAKFDQIQFLFNPVSSQTIFQVGETWEYWNGGAWVSFTPSDDTEGMRQNGLLQFSGDDLAGWAATPVNAINKFYIRVTRTRNNIVTTPVLVTAKILTGTDYSWDQYGNITAHQLDLDGNITHLEAAIVWEGVTDDAFETTLTLVDPTADRTITLPDASGTVVLDCRWGRCKCAYRCR